MNVVDTTIPGITLVGDVSMTIEAPTPYVEQGATATDNVDGIVTVNVSGTVDTGTPGTYTLTYTASDAAGNVAAATRTVTVSDTLPPTIGGVPGTITIEAASGAGAIVAYTEPTATDLSSVGATIECAPTSGSEFPLGTTTVVCTASDASGNTAQATFDVIVQDTTPPVLTASPDPFPADIQGPDGATVDYSAAISVTDAVDPGERPFLGGKVLGRGDLT